MTRLLTAVPVRRQANFLWMAERCYGREAWHLELNQWLRDEAHFEALGGTSVWAYREAPDRFVGFSSQRCYEWRLEGRSVVTAHVPALALCESAWGEPKEQRAAGLWESLYCNQVMSHVEAQARALQPARRLLTLLVHPGNVDAIRFYRRCGFQDSGETDSDPATGLEYPLFIKPL